MKDFRNFLCVANTVAERMSEKKHMCPERLETFKGLTGLLI